MIIFNLPLLFGVLVVVEAGHCAVYMKYIIIDFKYSSEFDVGKGTLDSVSNSKLVLHYFVVGESPLQRSETYLIGLAHPVAFLVVVGVDLVHTLDQIPTDFSNYTEEVIRVVVLIYPHRNVLQTFWIFAKFLKLANLSVLKLVDKPCIFRPKKSHIWDIE